MTTEEKAKAYDEAIERARRLESPFFKQASEIIFPELAESENERIRKMLIERVRTAEELNEELRGWIISYLEKQKEQKPIDIDFVSDWLRKHIKTYVNSEYNEFHKTVEYDGSINIERLIEDLEKAIEQQPFTRENNFVSKSAEWSEEEEKDIQEASDYLRDYANNCVQGGNSKLYIQSLADRIESLRPQPQGIYKTAIENILEMCESCRLSDMSKNDAMNFWASIKIKCKNAIQSASTVDGHYCKPGEEDEKIIEKVIDVLNAYKSECLACYSIGYVNDLINKLKSITVLPITYALDAPLCYDNDMNPVYPPINHWKPSEEQMGALEHFIRSWGESGTMSPQNPILCAAKSLYNELKKL